MYLQHAGSTKLLPSIIDTRHVHLPIHEDIEEEVVYDYQVGLSVSKQS